MITATLSLEQIKKIISYHKECLLTATVDRDIAEHQKRIKYYENRFTQEVAKPKLQRALENLKACEEEYARLGNLEQRNIGPRLTECNMEVLFWENTLKEIKE